VSVQIPESNQLSRIWWCPTGPVSFLPIHAAGLYGANMSLGSKLSDFVVSSYTSTLSALIESLKASNRVQKKLQLLLVAQPSADGQRFLPGTQQELDIIQKHAQRFSVSKLLGNDATVKNVATELKKCNWVHFACHGVQDTLHPTKSALLLEGNSRLTLTEISKLSFPNACLAFLSACQTATGTEHVSEEAAHLAAGMQSAGYHGVIATLWSILDRDAPLIADAVYAHLLNEEHPDPTQAAHALHFAVQKLCNNSGNNSFFSWVPFIHIGV
jgi:CHAT domain-containing protein